MAVLCCSNFELFFRFVLRQDSIYSILYFGGEGLQVCVARGILPADVLSTVARSRYKQLVIFAVFEALCGDSVCKCPFLLLLFSGALFKLQWTRNNCFKKTTRELFNAISLYHFVPICPFVTQIIFLDMNKIPDIYLASVFLKKCLSGSQRDHLFLAQCHRDPSHSSYTPFFFFFLHPALCSSRPPPLRC